jgi:hypothetical protein
MTHVAAALCLALLTPPAVPPSDAELEARYQDAVIALQENHPEVAFGLFEWVLTTVSPAHVLRPLAMYGAARAASASTTPGHACPGEAHSRAYLALADGDPSKRERLSKALPELESRCAAERPAPAPTPALPSDAPAPASASAALEARLAAPVVAPAEAEDTGVTLRRAGWISLAAGAALTAAGGYFWYAAAQAQDDAAAATTIARHGERADALETANGWALGLTLAGGLGLAGGTGFLFFGGPK